MPIRMRLTLWYTLLLGTTLIVSSIILYWVLKLSLHNQIDNNLQDRAQQIMAGIQIQAVSDLETRTVFVPEADVFSSSATFVQVIRRDGSPVSASNNLGSQRFPVDEEILEKNLKGDFTFKTVTVDNTLLRIYSTPIITRGQVVGAVQVGQSIAGVENTLRRVLVFLTGGTVMALVMAVIVGAFLSWTALHPIKKINQTAIHIVSGRDLQQRLPSLSTKDELERLTNTINNMLERLDNFFQAQVRLSADVSHELRVPLVAIQGNVDLLRRGTANHPGKLNQVLSVIDGELDRASRLVADLLLLSQTDSELNLRLQPLRLSKIILDVYQEVRMLTHRVNIQLGHEDHIIVLGDSDLLEHLLINLVTNAIWRTGVGGKVTLSLHQETDRGYITVVDTGERLAPTALPPKFDRVYWLDEGNNLSLAIAQWIAKAHGGEIIVTNELDKGSVFAVWLPTMNTPSIETRQLENTTRMDPAV